MQYTLSKHAEERLAVRPISRAWIERVLASPDRTIDDKIDPDVRHFLGKIPEFRDRVLRVIVRTNLVVPHIVTVHWDRSMRNKL